MSHVKKIIKNISYVTIGEILTYIATFFIIVLISRKLGDVGLGKYAFVFSFVNLFAIFSDLGMSTYVTREVAKNLEKKFYFVQRYIKIKLILAFTSLILPILVIPFIDSSLEILLSVAIVSVAIFFYNFMAVYRSIIRAHEKMIYISLSDLIGSLFFLLGAFIILTYTKSLVLLLIMAAIGYFLSFIAMSLLFRRIVKKIGTWKLNFKELKEILSHSIPFWFTLLFLEIYFRIDTVMLSIMQNYQATGWYNAAYRIIEVLTRFAYIFVVTLFPAMSRFFGENKKEALQSLFNNALYYLFILALPLAVGGTIIAKQLIFFVYGAAFSNSVFALQILIWVLLFTYLIFFSGNFLNAINKQKLYTISVGLGTLSNIILNILLIPKYSYIGASIATLATNALNFTMLYYFITKNNYKITLLKNLARPIIAVVIMAAVVIFMAEIKLHLLIIIPFAAMAYFATLILIKGLDIKGILRMAFKSK